MNHKHVQLFPDDAAMQSFVGFNEAIQNEFLLVLLQLPTLEQQKVDEQRPPPAGREFYRKFRASVHTTLKDENWILIQDYTHNKRQQTSFPLETV